MQDFRERFLNLDGYIFDWDSCLTHTYPLEEWGVFSYLYSVYFKNHPDFPAEKVEDEVAQTFDGGGFGVPFFKENLRDNACRDAVIRAHQGRDVSHFKETACPQVLEMLEFLHQTGKPVAILSNSPTCTLLRGLEASGWGDVFNSQLVFGIDRVDMHDKHGVAGYIQVVEWMRYVSDRYIDFKRVAMTEDSLFNLMPFKNVLGGVTVAIKNRTLVEDLDRTDFVDYQFPTIQDFSQAVLSL